VVAGLPLDSWILIVVSVGIGVGLELAFLRARRGDAKTRDEERSR
jgi:hypothetical protein